MKIADRARSAPPPLSLPDEVRPDAVRRATDRLVAYISGRTDEDGMIRERCESRVLESALALNRLAEAEDALVEGGGAGGGF